jgi:hypothetical protein
MKGSVEPSFTFRSSKSPTLTQMHHAAAFAHVRWTNLHDASGPLMFLRGDLISGPVAGDYGPAALDLNVQPRRQGFLGSLFPRLFTHTLYWRLAQDRPVDALNCVTALRLAVNVLDDPLRERDLMALFARSQPSTHDEAAALDIA